MEVLRRSLLLAHAERPSVLELRDALIACAASLPAHLSAMTLSRGFGDGVLLRQKADSNDAEWYWVIEEWWQGW